MGRGALNADASMRKAFQQTAACHGCRVSLDHQPAPWLVVAIPVDYQDSPVTVFVLPKARRSRITTLQRNRLKHLRAAGELATWLQAPEYLELLIYGVRNRTLGAGRNGRGG